MAYDHYIFELSSGDLKENLLLGKSGIENKVRQNYNEVQILSFEGVGKHFYIFTIPDVWIVCLENADELLEAFADKGVTPKYYKIIKENNDFDYELEGGLKCLQLC